MEEKDKKILIDKIIKEQDLVSLYAYNNFNKSLDIMQEYSNGILYSDLSRFILKNPQIMDTFSIKNLHTILASVLSEDERKVINEKIDSKLEEQDFFCEDISRDFFTQVAHSSNIYGKLNKSSVEKIWK